MINKSSNSPAVLFKFVKKAFTYQNSALVPFSFVIALVLQDLTNIYIKPRIQVMEVFLEIFSVEVVKGLILSIMVFIAGLGMYILVFVFDFITGLKAARKEHLISAGTTVGYIKSDKLWSSTWKFFAVIVISFILTVVSCVLTILDQNTLQSGGLLIMLFFFIMVISFDMHSIGENQERRFGHKPAFYNGMDKFFKIIGDLLMLRIKKVFGGDSYGGGYGQPPYDDYNDNNPRNEDL